MRHEVERILNQLQRAWVGDAWHGPAVREVLNGVSAEQAAQRPIADAHTIWEITLHVGFWEDAIRRRLKGEIVRATDAENFPTVRDASADAWAGTIDKLERSHHGLAQEVARLEDDQLDEMPPNGKVPRYVSLHGIIQHDLYHAGQIAVLRKAKPASVERRPVTRADAATATRSRAGGSSTARRSGSVSAAGARARSRSRRDSA